MRDKAISEMAEILFPLADRVIATRAENPRSASAEQIQQAVRRTGIELDTASDVASAIDLARTISRPGAIIVITGSIYLVGEAMRLLETSL